jgi:hypothetical protein
MHLGESAAGYWNRLHRGQLAEMSTPLVRNSGTQALMSEEMLFQTNRVAMRRLVAASLYGR